MLRIKWFLLILFFSYFSLSGQELKKFRYDIAYGLSLKCNFGQYESSFSLSSSIGVVMKGLKRSINYSGFSPNVGMILNINSYLGGTGTSLRDNLNLSFNSDNNPLYFDFVISPFIDIGHDKNPSSIKINNFKIFNQMSGVLNLLYNEYSFILGSSYVINFGQNRFQQVGSLLINLNRIQLCYFNDGPPFSKLYGLFLGDGQDRFWTGGGYLRCIFNDNNFRDFNISFERFTSSAQDQFNIGSLFGLNHVPVSLDKQFFNRGKITMEASFKNSLNIIYSPLIGDHKNWDLQNWIHRKISKNPYHSSLRKNMFQIGLGYNYISK